MKTCYEKELQALKPDDAVQNSTQYGPLKGYNKIYTAGHGYLIVPKTDSRYTAAKRICRYGFVGKLAVYLEEDCEIPEFLDSF